MYLSCTAVTRVDLFNADCCTLFFKSLTLTLACCRPVPRAGFLSEDTVSKVKVLGKGEAGLKQLEEYIPKVRRDFGGVLGGWVVLPFGATNQKRAGVIGAAAAQPRFSRSATATTAAAAGASLTPRTGCIHPWGVFDVSQPAEQRQQRNVL